MYQNSPFSFILFPFVFAFGLIGFLIGIGAFIFWVAMLVDVIQRKFKNPTDKIIWVLVIIFTHIVGAILYYFLVKKSNKK